MKIQHKLHKIFICIKWWLNNSSKIISMLFVSVVLCYLCWLNVMQICFKTTNSHISQISTNWFQPFCTILLSLLFCMSIRNAILAVFYICFRGQEHNSSYLEHNSTYLFILSYLTNAHYDNFSADVLWSLRRFFFNPLGPFWYYLVFETTILSNLRNYSTFIFGFHHQIMSGSLMRLE